MSLFYDIDWIKKGVTETCLHNANEVTAFATPFKPGHWCFLESASENTWWTANSIEPQGKLDIVAFADGWHVLVSHCTSNIFSDKAIIAWTVEEMMKKLPLPRYSRQQADSHENYIGKKFIVYMQSNLPVVVWYRKIGTYSENIRRPRANRSRLLSQARGDGWLWKVSEQAAFARTVENGQVHHQRTCFRWKQLYSYVQRTIRTNEFSTLESTISSERTGQDRTSDWNWIEIFNH